MENSIKQKSLFKNKNFALTYFGALVSNVGATLYSFATSFYILKLSDNNSVIQGSYLAACGITFLLFCSLGGVIADRFNKAKTMYLCDFAKGGAILFSVVFLTLLNDSTSKIVLLFVLGIISQFIAAIFSPSSASLLPIIVEEERLQEANALYSILNSFQSIVGILLAGLLYSLVPINILFLIVGICYVGSGISELFIKYNYQKKEGKITIKSSLNDIKEGFKYIVNDKLIIGIIGCIIFINFFFVPVWDNAIPYMVETDFAIKDYIMKDIISPEMWSSIFSVLFGTGSLIGGIVIQKTNFKKPVKTGKLFLLFEGLMLMAFTISYIIFVENDVSINTFIISVSIGMLFIGMSLVFFNVPMITYFQKRIDINMLGKASSALDIGSQGLIPIATFLAGLIISSAGVSTLLIVCTIGVLAISIIFLFDKHTNEI